jgi:Zn-dependent M28 family amino/carboxypeptidase
VFGDHHRAMLPPDQEPQTVEAVVRDDQADAIERMLAGTAQVQLQLELRNQFRPGPVRLDNVIAELRGSQWPDEVVIVCAHLDSWHQATGATDNGTGTCSTLEAARILATAGAKPRRTIRFILWTGEEEGLLGSRQYVVQHRREMPRVSAVFNHDSGTNWAQGLTVPASEADDFTAASAPVLQWMHPPEQGFDGAVFALTPRPVLQPAGGGSDHASFGAVGVPAFGWHLHGESQYGYGWHSQWDTYDIVIGRYQRHTATVIALVALGIANLDHLLSRQGVERAKPSGGLTAQLVVEAWLGIELDGLKVTAVDPGGSGNRAGLLPGDMFAAVAGNDVADATALLTALRTTWQEAAAAKVSVERPGGRVEVTLVRP